MTSEDIGRTLQVLGKEHSLGVLKAVYESGWIPASDLASRLDMHIATAQKYLEELAEIGILESREVMGKTRLMKEYRVLKSRVEILLDLSLLEGRKRTGKDELQVYYEILFAIYEKANKVMGRGADKFLDDLAEEGGTAKQFSKSIKKGETGFEIPAKAKLKGLEDSLIDSIEELIGFCKEELGEHTVRTLVRSSTAKVIEDNEKIIRKRNLLARLPGEYFEDI